MISFLIADGVTGVATLKVYLKDDGGTAYGGMNRSTTQSYTIRVMPLVDCGACPGPRPPRRSRCT